MVGWDYWRFKHNRVFNSRKFNDYHALRDKKCEKDKGWKRYKRIQKSTHNSMEHNKPNPALSPAFYRSACVRFVYFIIFSVGFVA